MIYDSILLIIFHPVNYRILFCVELLLTFLTEYDEQNPSQTTHLKCLGSENEKPFLKGCKKKLKTFKNPHIIVSYHRDKSILK